ncbi:MAG: class B sortase [Clostridia bacterium]|nr:class B sortase [Clostridia bacterium]
MKQDNKAVLPLICVLLAIVAGLLTFMTVKNLKADKTGEVQTAAAAAYTMPGAVEYDALNAALAKVQSKQAKSAKYPDGILENLKQVYAINDDVAGRLTIPGTEMDTVVMQSSDNDYYLRRDFYDRYTYETSGTNYGNIYLDYRCSNNGYLDKNTVIHGHTTGRDTGVPKQSFRSLYDYRDRQHFINCPIIRYSTLYGEYTYKICAVFYSTTQPSADNGYFFNYIYPDMSDSNMIGYIEQVKQRALYETGVSLEPTDKIITLSTCIYDYGKSVDTRLVVVGRLLHEGESTAIDPALVKDHPDYRRPQIWYNSKGKTNPYRDSISWQPSPN